MANKIFGVDIDSTVTPLMVRDAIIECFWEAHCRDTGIDEEEKDTNRSYCKSIVEKAFKDSDGDFNQPTKESIQQCLNNLKTFSKSFRDPSIIEKHYNDMLILVNKL